MTRSERMKRISRLMEVQERSARRDLATARAQHDEALGVLVDVFEQCRAVAHDPQEMSIAFGRELIESGWLQAGAQQQICDQTEAEASEASAAWTRERSRLDGLLRLIDRMETIEKEERTRRDQIELHDLVTSRWGLGAGDLEAIAS